jgi:3-oxoacyl-[acyl-carrier protein] reductase
VRDNARVVSDSAPIPGRALVTGAGRDREIGTAVCRALAARGHAVAFTIPPGGDGSALAAELGASAIEADLADPAAGAAVLDEAARRLGAPPVVLVNNAAHSVNGGYAEMDAATLDAHYAVNVRAPVLLSCELARRHPHGEPGRIVCLTSGQSLGPMLGELPYATTKAALEMFVRQLAPEVMGLGITVNAVNPGVTDTGWVTEAIRGDVLSRMPAGRIGQSEDAARLIAWLCSADAAWVTGQVIGSEGGFVRR